MFPKRIADPWNSGVPHIDSRLSSLDNRVSNRWKKKKKKRKTHYFSRKMLLLSREASDFQTVSPFRNPELIFISITRRPRFLFSFPNLVSKLPSLDKPFAYLTNSLNDYQRIPLLFPVPLVSSLDHFSLLPTRLTTRHPTWHAHRDMINRCRNKEQ